MSNAIGQLLPNLQYQAKLVTLIMGLNYYYATSLISEEMSALADTYSHFQDLWYRLREDRSCHFLDSQRI